MFLSLLAFPCCSHGEAFYTLFIASPPAQFLSTAVAVGVVETRPAVATGAMPYAILQDGLTSDLVLAVEGFVLFALESVVVEDVKGVLQGLSSLI